jgi:SAM-dependent methyltransferase
MANKGEPRFGLDPRRPDYRTDRPDKWEDVGDLDNLDMRDFMEVLKDEHGVLLGKDSAILEVGVGKARLLSRLKKEGYDVTGVEARKRTQHKRGLPIAHIRIEEMPFHKDTAQFDMVIATSVFDPEVYDQNEKRMMSRIADALRPGGVFVCGYIADFDREIPKHRLLRKLDFKTPGYEYMLAYQKV